VIDGEANMFLGEKEFVVRKGDFVFNPKNTPHSVKVISNVPLKVLSVQAPFFDGKDRVLLEE
jgi:mannose-6-phosphate isomerase-like protein (cupin superfamily)